ncbi:MAG: hypothetical protein RLZZ628_4127 [Bacteroidota bacterium]|jgi:hypothetical protein
MVIVKTKLCRNECKILIWEMTIRIDVRISRIGTDFFLSFRCPSVGI